MLFHETNEQTLADYYLRLLAIDDTQHLFTPCRKKQFTH